jgi:hypothetical protein
MSSIESFYNSTFDVKRKALVSGTRISTAQTISSGNSGVFRPVSSKTQLFNEANWGKEYHLYCANIDVKAGDNIEIDSTTYGVEGVSYYEDLEDSTDSHLMVVITKK